jgi:type IV secretory pathway VirB3-like protein
MRRNNQQSLFWSVSRPIKYLGLTVDEWLVACLGVLPGIVFLNNSNIRLGGGFLLVVLLCVFYSKNTSD